MKANPTLTPIGVTHCAFANRHDFPISGCEATIEIFEPYVPALDQLETSSHLFVLGYLHHADRTVLRASPRKVDVAAAERGVLATRSPDRPNPVSVTVVRLMERDGRNLLVERLDLLDGTPILDLKPYCPGWDGVYSARHTFRARPGAIDDATMITILRRDLETHMGTAATSHEARLVLAAGFLATRRLVCDLRDATVRVAVNRIDGHLDAVTGLSGAAFHDGRLKVLPNDGPTLLRFEAGGRRLSLRELPTSAAALADPSRWETDAFATYLDDVEPA